MIKRGRSKDWDEGLAGDLQDRDFAREFLLAAVEEDISIQASLGKVIRAYGLKEFTAEIDMPRSNLSRALRPSFNDNFVIFSRGCPDSFQSCFLGHWGVEA